METAPNYGALVRESLLFPFPEAAPRQDIISNLPEPAPFNLVHIITGVRRSGKTFYEFQLIERLLAAGVPRNRIFYFNFVDDRLKPVPKTLLNDVLDEYWRQVPEARKEGAYLFFDEVQEAGGWQGFCQRIAEREKVTLIITGSSSKLSSDQIASTFRGRSLECHMFPLSFAEFMSACDGETWQGWQEYLRYGGLPFAAALQTDEEKSGYLRGLFQETCLKDITERRRLRKDQELEDLPQVLASSIGSLTTPSKITSALESKCGSRIALNTVKSYIDCLKEAFLISEARRCDVNVKGRKAIGSAVK